ncbi:hypothetical protein HNP55_001398 [Paucibacter oligotrophus]|uniref:DUF3108 domain-containing protein n=1 Tax=Roseateles oligotrophus TaxID=1769250 RepID=A0A840L7Y3_9BURK|nr:hypothetical protein [Roseateles oligotrophus]MBB4842883.1 hypothetical protein [Roseateles oligotrophus]
MKIKTSLRLAVITIPLLLALGQSQAQIPGPVRTADLPGHYYLQGQREVGSELLLRADGSFAWMMSYGAVDKQAEGRWTRQGQTLTLLSSRPSKAPVFRVFEDDELSILKPAAEGSWVAIVGLPGIGPAAGMEVQFQARSGKTATAVTDSAGDAKVAMPATEVWLRAGLRPQGQGGKWQWLDVPAERAEARIAGFAIDDARHIVPAGFKRMELRLTGSGSLRTESLGSPMTYVKE